jgi:ligand-binding SRPBCC domain-containing protein
MYQLKRTHFIKANLDTCWEFFSSPDNLSKITPKYMGFEVLTDGTDTMYEGLMIEYRVRPLFNLPMKWITEITHVKDQNYFVDEQRKGPYTIWHHEHHFKEVPGGVEMTDIVSYELPFGFLGKLVHPFVVKPKLESIFVHRFKVVEDLFNK